MTLIAAAIRAVEHTDLPDPLTRFGIDFLCGRTRRALALQDGDAEREFALGMTDHPVAEHADLANEQHYELPPEFFGLVLGPHRKYSSCLFERGDESLAEAEESALAETVAHADLQDGQTILELGCGWGSLTLFMAARYPAAKITAVSNSKPQGEYIRATAAQRGLANVTVITADMNEFQPPNFVGGGTYDRIVSVEMFEHMANWRTLLERVRDWLAPEGRLFIHIFTHRNRPYRFDHRDQADWIAQHFFTGGIMPSHGLIRHFPDCFEVEADWRWNGRHYQKTAQHWLANMDAQMPKIDLILAGVYGREAPVWRRRWRLFFLATSGLFGHAGGEEWAVSHYRLKPVPQG